MDGEKVNLPAGKAGIKRFDKAFKVQAVKMFHKPWKMGCGLIKLEDC